MKLELIPESMLGLQVAACFYAASRAPDSGPNTYTVNALSTEPSSPPLARTHYLDLKTYEGGVLTSFHTPSQFQKVWLAAISFHARCCGKAP